MAQKKPTPEQLAQYFDHSLLKANAPGEDFELLCKDARAYRFKIVVVNPAQITRCRRLLAGSGVRVGATVGFPLGQNTLETKLFETREAIANGADEIDYVINISALKDKAHDLVEKEMRAIVACCREKDVTSKVIFENCYLTDDEKKTLCEIALAARPDFIKTSTGFGTGGATAEDVMLMKAIVGDKVKIKASGGIRTLETALSFIALGAERIGSSFGREIVDNYRAVYR